MHHFLQGPTNSDLILQPLPPLFFQTFFVFDLTND